MSYSIGVYLPHNGRTLPGNPEDLLLYLEQLRQTYCIYEKPLGDDLQVAMFWSGVANELGLPYIASMHQHGLVVSGSELHVLRQELDILEDYWCSSELSALADYSLDDPLADLLERLNDLRDAIDVAEVNQSELIVI